MGTPPPGAVAKNLTMRCLDSRGVSRPMVARFEYDPADPYAVWIGLASRHGEVRWAICRELLSQGLTAPAGEGDLQLWPGLDEEGHGVVTFEFRSPDGHLAAQAPARGLHDFLGRSLAVVPFGAEDQHLDVDAWVSELLGSSPAE